MSKVEFHKARWANLLATLSEEAKPLLSSLYESRMMTETYLHQVYGVKVKEEVLEKGLIKQVEIMDWHEVSEQTYFLTNDGVGVVRQLLNLPDNIATKNNVIIQRFYYKACDLEPRKPAHLRKLLSLTRFIERLKLELATEKPGSYRYLDKKFNDLYLKQNPNYQVQQFGADGIFQLFETDIHVFETQEKPQKINYHLEKTLLPFCQNQYPSYLERQQFVLFLVETNDEAKQYRKAFKEQLGEATTPYFNLFIMTPNQAERWIKHQLVPQIKNPFHFKELFKRSVGEQVVIGGIKEETAKQLKGRYDFAISYNNQVGFVVDYRHKDILHHYTIDAHPENQRTLGQSCPLIVVQQTKVSEADQQKATLHRIHFLTFEQLKEGSWVSKVFPNS